MTSKDVLNNLAPFWELVEILRKNLEKSTKTSYTSTLQQSYGFIIIELRDAHQQLFLEAKYQLQHQDKLSLYSFYCDDKKKEEQMKAELNQMPTHFKWETSPSKSFKLSAKEIQYLAIADRIAEIGNDIHATPSYYGNLIITSTFIKLEQINHWNSKSLDHKDSYFLRDLYFVIPRIDNHNDKKSPRFGSFFIGQMEVFFQDGSAKMHHATGDKISAQIRKEMKNYH